MGRSVKIVEGGGASVVVDGRPPSTIRKTLADCSAEFLKEFDSYIVHSWVVVHSPLLRGVITAITWMTPMRLSSSPTCALALEDASRALQNKAIALPEDFDVGSCVRPNEPKIEAQDSRRGTG